MRSMLFATLVWVLAAPALDSAPGAPVNLTSSVSGSTVTLTWSAPAGGGTPTAYIIEAGSSPGLANLASINTGSAATSFSTTGVTVGTYFVRVKAMNAAGTSSASNEATLSVSGSVCTAPGAPGGLTLVTNSGGTVSVSWTAATGSPATYIIEAGSAPGSSDLANSDLGSVATTFTATSVSNGGYYIRVRARNACGTSGPSNEIVVTVGPTTPLGVGRWNTPCAIQGQLAIVGLYLVCDGGKWRYATYADAPPAPHGYVTRPAWYPGLFSSQMACPRDGVHLTYSPLPVDQLTQFNPYGVMVGDHVTPIDHAYLGIKSLDKPIAARTESDYVPVTTAAAGVILELSPLGSPTSNRVVIDHGCGIFTVYMVINRVTGVLASYSDRVTHGETIRPNLAVEAGVEFGRQRDNPLDFNVFDEAAWLPGFANVFSYGAEPWKPYTADPTPYFTPTLASLYQSLSRRAQAPRWGKIDFDVIGTAQGNWFLDGTLGYGCLLERDALNTTTELHGGPIAGKNGAGSYCQLSLSPHWLQPGTRIASIGWWSDPAGDFPQMSIRLQSGQPTPDQLTAASGVVVYELARMSQDGSPPVGSTQTLGMLALRVNTDGTLTVETLPGATSASAFAGFTARQRKYHR